MSVDVLTRRLSPPRHLPERMSALLDETMGNPGDLTRSWTGEQRAAIERREGDLLLAAGAGSGKTSVLVERFVASVREDGIGVGEILTITFTEKAAAEMRDRIRLRLRELGEEEAAAATEGAFIATIHGFCARVLRAHALSAGIDPAFAVLDAQETRRLAAGAFAAALEELATSSTDAVDLIAAYDPWTLRGAILGLHDELRSRGQLEPALPELPPAPPLAPALDIFRAAAAAAAAELGAIAEPGVRVVQALTRLERVTEVLSGAPGADPWPGRLFALALPKGNGAFSTPVCEAYTKALDRLREVCEHRRAVGIHALLDRLLRGYARHYRDSKRARSALDFADLELLARELLLADGALRERYRTRFKRIMVDELQDTNAVQLELIASVAAGNLFTVGDAQQAIYGFRHADVELFERLATERRATGRYATLRVNFRSRSEILDVLNHAFADELGERFHELIAGREDPPAVDPRVELLLVDKGADWQSDGLASPWRLAEARALAARVGELLEGGDAARDIVLLTRATTDLRTYERALEERGVPTYLIGGRGYWGHPQVIDIVGYLRALANPRDEESLYTVLASPMVGASLDALVILAAAAQAAVPGSADASHPWAVLETSAGALAGLHDADRARLAGFTSWFAAERAAVGRTSIEALIDRGLAVSGYDLAILGLPGGRRRLANVRKLMRLAREHEAAHGPGLRAFLELMADRSGEGGGDPRESEAPVEGEALDAVRLMTIHRSKGLEFDTVCVADLGRTRWVPADLIRLGRDGRIGLRLAEPGSGRREPALHYRALGDERAEIDDAEERRLFYVAMTRAKERLVLSGAARLDKLESWPEGNGGSPAAWIAPAVVDDFTARAGEGSGVTERGVAFTIVREAPAPAAASSGTSAAAAPAPVPALAPTTEALAPAAGPSPATLSYSALADYDRCGYRFYVERVLGLPPAHGAAPAPAGSPGGLAGADRGVLAHALLEQLDFRHPLACRPDAVFAAARRLTVRAPSDVEARELAGLVSAFSESELFARLAAATQVRREQRFSFRLEDDVLMTGALDVVARERAGMLVVDYKSDRLLGSAPAAVVAEAYAGQRLIYALAVLLSGAELVEVAHVFLERPHEPVLAAFDAAQIPELRNELTRRAAGIRARRFEVTAAPYRSLCAGCPAEGGLCSWPLTLTRRERPDQLF